MKRKNWLIGALALGICAVAACEDVEPGDYVVYRVATSSSSFSEGCYFDYQGADANVRNDTSSLHVSRTFVLYAGVETTRYLDVGEVTLDGEHLGEFDDGEGYEFEGRTVDVEWSNPAGSGSGAKRTTTVDTQVEMTVDGELAFGEVKITTTWACTGEGCGQLPPACTETLEFVGTEVEDVQLEHDVPPGFTVPTNPSTGSGPVDDDGSGGSSAGGGGAGGAGGGGTCNTCSEVAFSQGALSTEDLCPGSQDPFENYLACACSTCIDECSESTCVMSNTIDSLCGSCLVEFCTVEYDACINDAGDAGGS